jgi:hypothetical protein
MPWKKCSVMDERLRFVAELCREFGISRKTGYKIFDRYQECGVEGLTDRSRRPYAASLQAYVVQPTANGPVGVGHPPGVIQPQESKQDCDSNNSDRAIRTRVLITRII